MRKYPLVFHKYAYYLAGKIMRIITEHIPCTELKDSKIINMQEQIERFLITEVQYGKEE